MGKINIKNGTPIGSTSMCDSCSNAQILRGFRESELLVLCTYTFDKPLQVPFKVSDCTMYRDKNRPTYEQMEDLALDIKRSTTLKPAGFNRVAVPTIDEGDGKVVPDTVTINS
jgi:hypothetical protein